MSSDNRGLASADEETKERVSRKGGEAVSQDTEHMAEIGRKGGESVSQDTQHMAEIGAKGGQASHGGGNQGGNQGQGEGRGFAGMSEEERKKLASKGGKA